MHTVPIRSSGCCRVAVIVSPSPGNRQLFMWSTSTVVLARMHSDGRLGNFDETVVVIFTSRLGRLDRFQMALRVVNALGKFSTSS